jgi:FAD/FMN-containing dehydrogenase
VNFEGRSLIVEVPTSQTLERLEAACLSRGLTPGPLTGADPKDTLAAALHRRVGRCSPLYGDLWDRVLSVEAELPGGRTLRTRAAPRMATGPDIGRTLLEARGRLGSIRTVWLRLFAAPRERVQLRARASDLPAAVTALGRLLREGARPAEVELCGALDSAELMLRFEGEAGLCAAERDLARHALAAFDLSVEEVPPTRPAATGQSAAVPFTVHAPWSRLAGEIRRALSELGARMPGPARLVWMTHDAAGIDLPWPPGMKPFSTTRPRAEALLDAVAQALERRSA